MSAVDRNALAARTAPGPTVPRCVAPGCREYASCGLRGTWYCGAHVPDAFWAPARAHAAAVRIEGRERAA